MNLLRLAERRRAQDIIMPYRVYQMVLEASKSKLLMHLCRLCFAMMLSANLPICAEPLDTIVSRIHPLSAVEVKAQQGKTEAESTVPVQYLSDLQMKQLGISDISDALNHFSGVTLRDYGGAGGIKTVSVRGMGASHTAVSYDGIPLSDVQTGQVDLGRFSVRQIRSLGLRVGDNFNLLQPARSAAAAAMVDIGTLQGGLANGIGHLHIGIEQGSWDRYGATIYGRHRLSQAVALSALGDYLYSGNGYPYTLRNGFKTSREHRTNSRMLSYHGEANLFWTPSEHNEVTLKAYYYDNNHHLPGIVTLYNPYNAEVQHERNAFAQGRWLHTRMEHWSLQILGKYNWAQSHYQDRRPIYTGGRYDQSYWQRETYTSAVLAYSSDTWGVSWASDYIYNNLNSNQALAEDASRHSILNSLTLSYTPRRWQLNARLLGACYLNHADGQVHARNAHRLSPSLSAAYRITADNSLNIRIFYKDIYRVPTFTEAYYYHLGNTNLRPERVHQFGAGMTFDRYITKWLPELKVLVDAYSNRVRDKITSIPISLYTWRTLNIGRVNSQGLDASLSAIAQPAAGHRLTLSTHYTWQRVVDRTARGTNVYDRQLAYIPRHSGSLSAGWENPWVNIALNTIGASSRWGTHEHSHGTKLKGYMELGGALWREIHFSGFSAEVRAVIHNMLDKQYDIVNGYPMPGRSYLLSLTLNL